MRNRLRLALTTVMVIGLLGVGGATIAQAANSGSSTTNKSSGTSTNQSQSQSRSNQSSESCPNM
jgi:hypothetical protein